MNFILPDKTLGIVVMFLFAMQGAFVLFSPGSIRFQKPKGGLISWAYNVLNLATILVLTPLAAFCLIKAWKTPLEITNYTLWSDLAAQIAGGLGLGFFIIGNVLLYWSRIILGRSFRLGAVKPRDSR